MKAFVIFVLVLTFVGIVVLSIEILSIRRRSRVVTKQINSAAWMRVNKVEVTRKALEDIVIANSRGCRRPYVTLMPYKMLVKLAIEYLTAWRA